jgi:hypothetical protein
MVRSGKWAVGDEGVEGGIEDFNEADTPEQKSRSTLNSYLCTIL